MWDLPGPGLEPVSPALASGFSTIAPPGKPSTSAFRPYYRYYLYLYENIFFLLTVFLSVKMLPHFKYYICEAFSFFLYVSILLTTITILCFNCIFLLEYNCFTMLSFNYYSSLTITPSILLILMFLISYILRTKLLLYINNKV